MKSSIKFAFAVMQALSLLPSASKPRKGAGNGRVYEIFFEASDGRGKSCTGAVRVGVPHDRGRGRT